MTLTYTAPTHKFPCLHPASNHISLPLSVSPPCILHYRLFSEKRNSFSISLSLSHTHTQLLMGIFSLITGRPGPSGFGSASTAEQVTEGVDASNLTAIVTGQLCLSFSMGFVFFSQSARSLGLFGQCCACNYMISELGFSSYLFFMAQHSLSFCVVLVSFPPFPVSWFLFLILCRVSWAVSVQWQCEATKEGDHNFLWNTVEAVKTKAPSFLLLPSFSSSLF